MLELQAEQVIAFAVCHPYDLRPQVLSALRNRRCSRQRGARDFERNLRCWPKSAVDGNQSSSRRHVQSGSELQKVLAAVIAAADKHRNRKRQSHPLASFCCRLALLQTCAPERCEKRSSRTYGAKLVTSSEACRSKGKVFSPEMASRAVFVGKRKT